jgi:hypothetical protein
MILVVDRSSRRVIDCQELTFNWKLDEVIERHDLDKVDLVLRERQETKPTAVADSFVTTEVEAPKQIDVDEDIPF